MHKILSKLTGGDLRSIGRSEEVVRDVLENPVLFGEVFEGLFHTDPRVRMRSADVLEKVSAQHPEYLQPFKKRLIDEVSQTKQQEVQWHMAQMFSYLKANKSERERMIEILVSYIDTSESKIVATFSIQTLANFAEVDATIRPRVIEIIESLMGTGSPAVVSRGRKLIGKLKDLSN